jgi:3-oxoacyl-[acyl-carrier-protein] synthase-3
MTPQRHSRITGTGSYLPGPRIDNGTLAARLLARGVETSDSWIVERTGIRARHFAAETEQCSDLAVHAARHALEAAGVDAAAIDLIIVATSTPDMVFPSTACIVQNKLGIHGGGAAFDVQAVCSGFVYALAVADAMIRNGAARKALVVGSEVFSRILNFDDRTTCVLFGDGAGAAVVQRHAGKRGILSTHLHSDGAFGDLLHIPGGGAAHPPSHDTVTRKQHYIKMKGNETFKVAVRALEDVVQEALDHNKVKAEDIDLLVPHQANLRIIQAMAKRLEMPMDKVVLTIHKYGNTSAASIPVALDEAAREGRIKENDLILLEAFGGGLTWASALLRW